jgi:hypothetical protein
MDDESSEGSVPRSQVTLGWLRPEEDTELMAEGQALGQEGRPRRNKGAEGAESEPNEAEPESS